MFSLKTTLHSRLGLKREITALFTMLAVIALFAGTAQASHNSRPYIIGTTVDLLGALNCKDVTSVEVGKTYLMAANMDAFDKVYTWDTCYKGGNVKIVEQAGDSFDTPFGTAQMVKVKRDDGTITVAIVRNEIMTQPAYDLSRALIVGRRPSISGFPYCNSAENVLAVLEKIPIATTEKSWANLVQGEFKSRGCDYMETEGSMVVREQIGEDAMTFVGTPDRAVRISRKDNPDVFAIVKNRMILTAAQADDMRKKADEAKE